MRKRVTGADFSVRCRLRALFLVSILAAFAGCSNSSSPAMPVDPTVQVAEARAMNDGQFRYSGRLRASERSNLSFKMDGFITTVEARLGDAVRKGDVLAQIDDTALTFELAAQKANLKNAMADLRDARLDFERRAALAGTGSTSQSVIDQAEARFERAEAQVASLKAQVGRSEQRVSDTRLVAPFSGEIVARLAEPSEVIQKGQPILKAIGDKNQLEAVSYIPESAFITVKVGQSADVHSLANGVASPGIISEIGTESNTAGLFPITVSLDSSFSSLRPGDAIEVHWARKSDAKGVAIPLTAFVPTGKRSGRVFIVKEAAGSTQVIGREVVLGLLHSGYVEVISGLEPGETIVVKGAELLETGDAIQTTGIGIARYNR